MWQLAWAIGEIALRRRGPENLPDSTFLTGFLLTGYVFVTLIQLLVHGELTWLSLGNLAAQIVLIFAFVFAVLTFFKLDRRYWQTMSAILGVNVVVILVYLPFALGGRVLNVALDGEPWFWVMLGFVLWSVLMEAHIFARAVSQPLILGFMLEILYVLPSLSVSEFFLAATD